VSTGSPRYSETLRQWVHIGSGAAALLLPFLDWYQAVILAAAAIIFNIRLLRKIAGERLHRPLELQQSVPAGLVLYPTSILIMLLMVPSRPDIVAGAWGILAVGDGAATLAGTRYGVTKWPWNRQKSVAGSIALAVAGGAAGALLCWWCRSVIVPPPYIWFSTAAPLAAAVVAAAVETVPIRLNDNLSVPLTAAAVLWALSIVSEDLVAAVGVGLPGLLIVALPVNAVAAAAGYAARVVSPSGAIVGAAIGTVIYVCAGSRSWFLLLVCFLSAAVASRMGLRRKTLLGIAEERGGRRGPGSAVANTGVAAVAAALAALSYGSGAALIAMTAALVASASDTVASEIGKAWGTRTWALLPPHLVRPGTPGAMSIEGTAAGLVSASGLAAVALWLSIVPGAGVLPIIIGSVIGATTESLLAAALEPSGVLNNDALNLINTAVAAYVAVSIRGLS
jgi:uncharacterized protein (TIGR00297 family)